MKRPLHSFACLLALCAGSATAAMYLDPHGQGQVLFYPYYTVNAGQSSLISLVNTTARGKYVAVSFHEGALGDTTLDFYLYLAPHDTWVGTLFALNADGVANLLTTDTTCTGPDLRAATLPKLADGRPYAPFFSGFTLPEPPAQGQALRTREGYIQVIEAGELDANAAGLASERRCAELRAVVDTTHFGTLSPPGGGLYGSLAIVNATAGTYFATQATAIGGFSDHVVLTNTAVVPATDLTMGVHEAQVSLGNRFVTATYASSVDAVSALLMSDALWGEFVIEPSAGASTEWVLSEPTKRYYTRQSPVPPPYTAVWRPAPTTACLQFGAELHDREQNPLSLFVSFSPPPLLALCHATDVLHFFNIGPPLTDILGSRLVGAIGDFGSSTTSGTMKMIHGRNAGIAGTPTILPAITGPTLRGLPVIGFQVVNYVNANVTQGVLANYAAAEPLRPGVACADANGAAVTCP